MLNSFPYFAIISYYRTQDKVKQVLQYPSRFLANSDLSYSMSGRILYAPVAARRSLVCFGCGAPHSES